MEHLESWYKAYSSLGGEDNHSVFAQLTGLDRQEAKELCHKLAYKVHRMELMKHYRECHQHQK